MQKIKLFIKTENLQTGTSAKPAKATKTARRENLGFLFIITAFIKIIE